MLHSVKTCLPTSSLLVWSVQHRDFRPILVYRPDRITPNRNIDDDGLEFPIVLKPNINFEDAPIEQEVNPFDTSLAQQLINLS